MRYLPFAALVALTCALCADAAPAVTKSPVSDRNDGAGPVDLSSVRATHDSSDARLIYTFRTYEGFGPSALRNRDGAPGSICVNIWTDRVPAEDPANYELCVTARPDEGYRGTIHRQSETGSLKQVGKAEVQQRSTKRLEVRFKLARIGSPRSILWTAETTTFGKGCPKGAGCEDFAPEPPETVKTDLR